jgi:NADH-quinone oxidoreductase subunit G
MPGKEPIMVKIRIDDRLLEAAEGSTVLKAALAAGTDIPHFCFHPAFEPEGSCRMCLVEIEGAPKLELACSTRVKDGMNVLTSSPKVMEARKEVLEFLLAEHPLDCPICDKAGECRLQDYYERYGRFDARFREPKEKRDKIVPIGRRLLLDRERCILCTRCVRFLREVTGAGELGVFERGARTEIGLYEDGRIDNAYSGNLAEICPVGAITDTDFRFKTRTWFLERGASICPHCGRGCNIDIDFRLTTEQAVAERRIFRVRARENAAVNGHWICDIGRYGHPYWTENRSRFVLMNKDAKTTRLSWDKALIILSEKIKGLCLRGKGGRLGLVLDSFLSNEELYLIGRIFREAVDLGNFWFADPKPQEADRLLLTAERSPNLRGARELGFESRPPDLKEIVKQIEVLLVIGSGLREAFAVGDVRKALDRVPVKFLFAAHTGPGDDAYDFLLPAALIAEKPGSLTNTLGLVQEFQPVWRPPGEARPEWEVLGDLARELGSGEAWTDLTSIREAMAREYPFFKKSHE